MRPCKPRLIGSLPPCSRFIPQHVTAGGECRIGLDMLEALRLVDVEGMPQEEAASAMDISPATLCRVLGEARRQVATALCQGNDIVIEGGNIMFRENEGMRRCGHGQHGHMNRNGAAAQKCAGQGRGRADGMGRKMADSDCPNEEHGAACARRGAGRGQRRQECRKQHLLQAEDATAEQGRS